jgi:hypothetical protein
MTMSSHADLKRRHAVPDVEATTGVDAGCLSEALREHEAVYVAEGGKTIAVALSPEAYRELIERVEKLELELRVWKSEVELRDGTLIDHEEVVASTEWLVAGED